MTERKEGDWEALALDWLGRNWKLVTLLCWLGFCAWSIFASWNQIRWFSLGDTDDNMRIMQVRGLLHGQGWYDLRNYRMNPPYGANIHWSRLVDLPIAGLILTLRPFLGGAAAERYAVALGGATAFCFLIFASNDNRNAVCDALSPVWLSNALIGSALMFGLAWLSPGEWKRRLGLAVVAALIIAGFHAFTWPQCLHR